MTKPFPSVVFLVLFVGFEAFSLQMGGLSGMFFWLCSRVPFWHVLMVLQLGGPYFAQKQAHEELCVFKFLNDCLG